jgi:hypothetical protein
LELKAKDDIYVYVFDPSKNSPADIYSNLEDYSEHMGDFSSFKQFVENTEPVDTLSLNK